MRKTFRFLYLPDDHEQSRELNVPTWLLGLVGTAALGTVLLAVFYVVGLSEGTSWKPGGSRLQQENAELARQVEHLGSKVAMLRENLAESYRLQELVSVAMGLDPMDPDVREAGVGGRGLVGRASQETPGDGRFAVALDRDIDTILRQARIQHEGYQALLDTLVRREQTLDHLPSIRPVDTGWLSSGYGYRHDPFTNVKRFHHGVDYSVPTGTQVRATADGVVTALKRDRGYGLMVRVDHGNGLSTVYAHLSEWRVKTGQKVRRGQTIALSGNTGRSTAPHLHYEVHVQSRHVNPLPYVLDNYALR